MSKFRKALFCSLACAAVMMSCPMSAFAQTASDSASAAPSYHDGQHDFDFNIGTWKTHIMNRPHPFTDAHNWKELNGTVTVRKIWGGKASLEEVVANGGSEPLEGLTLFVYNPQAHQWSQTWVSSSDGTLGQPAIGEFKDGRGEFIDQESIDGRTVLVRTVWSDIKPNSHHFEQSYSNDNGKTWEASFVANLTRIPE